MELRQLEYFIAVVEEASFTKAAAREHVAQPGVSAQIRRLEAEFGEALLDRSGRTVRLTEVGAAVLPYARAALEAVGNARLVMDELTGLVRGRVAVGMVVSCASVDLPDLLADFHKNHPAVDITLSEDNSDKLIESLLAGRLDLALIAVGSTLPPGIETQLVVDEALYAAVALSDELADRETVTLAEIQARPLISLPAGTGIRTCIEEACAAKGFSPHIALEASNLDVLAQLAARGLGVAIVPESLATQHPELHGLPITEPRMRGSLRLGWRADGPSSPAGRALVRHARSVLKAGSEPISPG
jgi:DNA-binding transcriptional LysR family regulator